MKTFPSMDVPDHHRTPDVAGHRKAPVTTQRSGQDGTGRNPPTCSASAVPGSQIRAVASNARRDHTAPVRAERRSRYAVRMAHHDGDLQAVVRSIDTSRPIEAGDDDERSVRAEGKCSVNGFVGPTRTSRRPPVTTSQTRADPPSLAVTTCVPSGLNEARTTWPSGWSRTRPSLPVRRAPDACRSIGARRQEQLPVRAEDRRGDPDLVWRVEQSTGARIVNSSGHAGVSPLRHGRDTPTVRTPDSLTARYPRDAARAAIDDRSRA